MLPALMCKKRDCFVPLVMTLRRVGLLRECVTPEEHRGSPRKMHGSKPPTLG